MKRWVFVQLFTKLDIWRGLFYQSQFLNSLPCWKNNSILAMNFVGEYKYRKTQAPKGVSDSKQNTSKLSMIQAPLCFIFGDSSSIFEKHSSHISKFQFCAIICNFSNVFCSIIFKIDDFLRTRAILCCIYPYIIQ